MAIINEAPRKHRVEFVSYDGKWPCLCAGILSLRIDGRIHTFGDQGRFARKLRDGRAPDHPKFWETGGTCPPPPDPITCGEWTTDASLLPEGLKPLAAEIDAVFNANAAHGCCGGCR